MSLIIRLLICSLRSMVIGSTSKGHRSRRLLVSSLVSSSFSFRRGTVVAITVATGCAVTGTAATTGVAA